MKAPQKSLKSSWQSEVFTKPKVKGMFFSKKSLSSRPKALVKVHGNFVFAGTDTSY